MKPTGAKTAEIKNKGERGGIKKINKKKGKERQ
jgi:hypothetical protein